MEVTVICFGVSLGNQALVDSQRIRLEAVPIDYFQGIDPKISTEHLFTTVFRVDR